MVNNSQNDADDGFYTEYNPIFRKLLQDALGFDALNDDNYDVRVRKIVLSEGGHDNTGGKTQGPDTVTSFHLEHLNLIVRMGLFENMLSVGSDGQGGGDAGERYRRFLETLHAVPALATPVGTARLDFGAGRHVAFATVWQNGTFFDDDVPVTVRNSFTVGQQSAIDSVIMPSLYALHRTDVSESKVLRDNTMPVTKVLAERAQFLYDSAEQSLRSLMDKHLRAIILAGREENATNDNTEMLMGNLNNEEHSIQGVRRTLSEVDSLRQQIFAHIENMNANQSDYEQNVLFTSDTVLLYDNLSSALFGRERGLIGNIGPNVYRGPAIVDLAYVYYLSGRDEDLMRLALTEYGVRSRAISQELNGELLGRVQELSEMFVLMDDLESIGDNDD